MEDNKNIWIVTISSDPSLESIKKELKRLGVVILQVFDQIGSLEVRCSEELASKVRKVPGIADVSRSISFDIGPGDSQIF